MPEETPASKPSGGGDKPPSGGGGKPSGSDKPASDGGKPSGGKPANGGGKSAGGRKPLPWLWLAAIIVGYTCLGGFLLILMVKQRRLALVGFIVLLLLPAISSLAEYDLMVWAYLLSGVVIVAGLIFLARAPLGMIVLAICSWLGIVAVPRTGSKMVKGATKRWLAIAILTVTCAIGLGMGWLIVWLIS
jgi:hypothetical protein